MTSVTPPPCPDCSTVTERIEVEGEGEEVWRCTAPDCTRRTYGTGDENDDFDLPSYSETDEHGAVVIYHGTGEVDFEATAELAAQDGPDDEDDDQEPDDGAGSVASPTARVWEPEAREIRVKDLTHVLAGGWVRIYGDPPEGWRHFTEAAYDPDHDTTVAITYSDGEVGREWPWPQALLVHADPDTIPTATRPGPARLVQR
ncbi:hypothetical protein ACIQ9J_33885 [Streptomyces sp. NPDC094153]|uniref:hypothetical protein n=1 Tax=Streptomyces sp. NPDC094153 TaxID=3366058 RepID=UPI00381117DB